MVRSLVGEIKCKSLIIRLSFCPSSCRSPLAWCSFKQILSLTISLFLLYLIAAVIWTLFQLQICCDEFKMALDKGIMKICASDLVKRLRLCCYECSDSDVDSEIFSCFYLTVAKTMGSQLRKRTSHCWSTDPVRDKIAKGRWVGGIHQLLLAFFTPLGAKQQWLRCGWRRLLQSFVCVF